MAGLMRREPRGEVGEFFGRFDRMFDEWARMMPFRAMSFPHWHDVEDLIRVEEFRDNGTLVIRADLPGIDPEKDVELTVSDGMLRIHAKIINIRPAKSLLRGGAAGPGRGLAFSRRVKS